MSDIENFLTNLEKYRKDDPMMARWLYSTEELKREFLERIVRLAKYPKLIPLRLVDMYNQAKVEAERKLKKYV